MSLSADRRSAWLKYRSLWKPEEAGPELVRQDPELYPQILDKSADKHAAFMRHFFSYLRDTPQQRYENLLRDQPQIIQRIPLQYIASYLGITPVSLSRIRNRG